MQRLHPGFRLLLAGLLLLTACQPAAPSGPTSSTAAAGPTATEAATRTVRLDVQSADPVSGATVVAATVAPTTDPSAGPEPVIFTGYATAISQACGHGDVVAPDGDDLRAYPRLGPDNFLEHLPEGARVSLIDCRLWNDAQGMSWLAVRLVNGKLGWMFVQPDLFYVTLYPIVSAVPLAITGLPDGMRVAYVPPSECRSGPVSNEALATSIGVDLIPVVGDVKGLGEAATGCDMVTGESLGNWRWLGLLGLVGLSEIALLRHADEAGDAARLADNLRYLDNLDGSLRYSDEVTVALLRNADTVEDLRVGLSHADELLGAGTASVRYADDGARLSDEALAAIARFEQPCSFSASTLVTTDQGLVPIVSVAPGDRVWAWDEPSDRQGYFMVTAAPAHFDQWIVRLTISGELIETTPEHPFYSGGNWVAAGDLRAGDLVASVSGEPGTVTSVERRLGPQIMYNLTVAQAHTFHVGRGRWLVHNACRVALRKNMISSGLTPSWARDGDVPWQAHHLIPYQYETNSDFVKSAIRGGWDINSADNGIGLPSAAADAERLGLPRHAGPHWNYSSLVEAELDSLWRTAQAEGWSDARSAQELSNLVPQLRSAILSHSGIFP